MAMDKLSTAQSERLSPVMKFREYADLEGQTGLYLMHTGHAAYCCVPVDSQLRRIVDRTEGHGDTLTENTVFWDWTVYLRQRKRWALCTTRKAKYYVEESGHEWVGQPYKRDSAWVVNVMESRNVWHPYDFVEFERNSNMNKPKEFFGRINNWLAYPIDLRPGGRHGRKGWKRWSTKAVAAFVKSAGGSVKYV